MKPELPKFKITKESFSPKNIRIVIVKLAKGLWGVLTRRFWLKLLSVFLAILLWNYVISNDKTITRNKVLYGLEGAVTNQASLSSYKLALLEDPVEQLKNVTVRLQVAQADFAYVTPDNVKVSLDLSGVRSAGMQEVPLKVSTTYGRVVEIVPSSVNVNFETLDSRSVPVSAYADGKQEDGLWYNVARTNPAAITVSGATSVVQSITMARVSSDVTDAKEDYTRAEQFILLDANGNEISQSMLSCSSTSVSVTMNVYPTKELPIAGEEEQVVTGKVAEGYHITGISIQPETVTVAADSELLEGLTEIRIEPVSVEGLTRSISARADLILLSDFKYVSTEQIYVNITIAPIDEANGEEESVDTETESKE